MVILNAADMAENPPYTEVVPLNLFMHMQEKQ